MVKVRRFESEANTSGSFVTFFSILEFNELYLFIYLIIFNDVKLGHTVTFMKYFSNRKL